MVIKYRRPTSASRVGQDMRNTWSHVVGNLATLVLLALAGCLGYLFWPYLPTLAWTQLVAFSLRGLRDRFKSVKYGIFYKRGAELSDSQAATRLMIYVALGSMLLGVLLTVGLAGDAVWAARTATSSFKLARSRGVPDWAKAHVARVEAEEPPPRILRRVPAQLPLVPAGPAAARRADGDDDGEWRESTTAVAAARSCRQGSVARLAVRRAREVSRSSSDLRSKRSDH